MYLTEFRKYPPNLGQWQNLYERVLESLSSWKETHEAMRIENELDRFKAIRAQVYSISREEVCNVECSWPIEAMAFTLINEWWNCHDKETTK